MSQVSVLGCGNMGRALIRALAQAGRGVTVWNRTTERAQGLEEDGVTVATSPNAAIEASPLIILITSSYTANKAILDQAGPWRSGKTVVHLTGCQPREARALSELVAGKGGSYIDGAILAYPKQIATPASTIVYGGDSTAFEAARPTLEVLGKAAYLGADPGAASVLEVAVLLPFTPMVVGLWQGLKICRLEGFPIDVYQSITRQVIPLMVEDSLKKGQEEDFATNPEKIECTVARAEDFTKHLTHYVHDCGIDPGIYSALARLFAGGVAAGRGEHDWVCAPDLPIVDANLLTQEAPPPPATSVAGKGGGV